MKAGILVVSNDNTVFDFIKPQLLLLRNSDTVYESDYFEAVETVNKTTPQLVILHCGYDLHGFIKLLKNISVPVIALFNNLNSDYLMTAYDNGIVDFLTRESSPPEILARVMFALKNKTIKSNLESITRVLKRNNILTESGFYVNPSKVFPYFLENIEFGTFLLISAKNTDLEVKIASSLRSCDIKAVWKNNYYIFLPYTDIDGAVSVVKKISHNINDIHTGICTHGGKKDFKNINIMLENALNVAIGSYKEYVIIDENLTPKGNWIEKISSGKKNFKLFKQEFNKMIEQVITPVFYQVQSKYETRLDIKIVQNITPELSSFKIKGQYFDSEFKLKSTGFSAITVDIIHNTNEKRFTLDLNEMESKTLEVLLEEFVQEHRLYMEELC